ncbi:MAG: DUF2877 domain-containing protein [Thermoflexales bacterium]|nr:DUF2877 domain-containing protein [Thermoflexales bacterium]
MNAISVGRLAAQVIDFGGEAKVIGVTSRGIFLALDRRVLFVSVERWRGPLTITVDSPLVCASGDNVRLSPTRLIFPAFEVDLSTADVWQPLTPLIARPLADQRDALKQLASSVLARKTPTGFGVLLLYLLDFSEKQALSTNEAALLARLTQLRESIRQSDFDQAAELIESLLGLGRGLTPSGDDVTIGVLLGLKPWRAQPSTSLRSAQAAFTQCVVESAYQRTTTLSANLIECAANGEADERLINVLTGLITGQSAVATCTEYVLDWGHSSGVDALIGLALTLTAV